MSTLKRISSVSLALLLIASYSATETQAQRRGLSPSMGRSMGAPGLSKSSGLSPSSSLSRGLSRSSIGARAAGPSAFHAGPSPGLSRSLGSPLSRSYSSGRYPSRGVYGSSIYSSQRPSSGLSISIGNGYSPSYRYGSLGRGYGLGYSYPYSSSPYSSGYGRYTSGYGYSPYYYSARPSIGLNIYSSPLLYSQQYPERYPSTYRYTQPVSPYTSSPYAGLSYQSYREAPAPERASGDPSDPRTVLRAGMILPDGSRVISVGALPTAGAASEQPTTPTPAQPVPAQPAPIESTDKSVLEKPAAGPVPAPEKVAPTEEDGELEELPAGNASKAEDV